MDLDFERELTTDEVAPLVKRTRTTLEIWRHQGKGPVFKKHPETRAVTYLLSDVKAWMESAQRYRSTSEQAA